MTREKGAPTGLANLTGVLVGVSLAAIGGAALAFTRDGFAAVGVVLLILASAFATGSLLGFLFGVPRVLSREGATTPQKPATAEAAGEQEPAEKPQGLTSSPVLRSNTNLERISDWLTTMIVGATLVELHRINEGLLGFSLFLAEAAKVFGSGDTANAGVLPAVGPVALIFGAVAGFLYMYVNTRLFLTRMFAQLENDLQNGGDQKLDPKEAKAVAQVAAESGRVGDFVRKQLASVSQMSVREALNLMRGALYRKGGYLETIKIGASLANTAAQNGQYWFLLAAAFGQQYADAVKKDDSALAQSTRDNALDAARRAIGAGESYRAALRNLTDPRKSDDDLAALYANDKELRDLLG